MTIETVTTALGPVSVERVGRGPGLVLLHSLLSDRHVFDPVIPALSERRRVTMVDLPGFGDTILVEPRIDHYADLVAALLEADGSDPATAVLGNGLGAFVALGLAVRHGELFGRLVLAGCGTGFSAEAAAAFHGMIAGVETGGMEAVIPTALLRIFTEDYLDAHPDRAEERRRVLRRTDPAAFVNACRSLIGMDYAEAAGRIANPTLVVVGSDDLATPPAMARVLADTIPGARLVELDGLAHAPQLQDPERFLSVVEPFLAP